MAERSIDEFINAYVVPSMVSRTGSAFHGPNEAKYDFGMKFDRSTNGTNPIQEFIENELEIFLANCKKPEVNSLSVEDKAKIVTEVGMLITEGMGVDMGVFSSRVREST